VNFPITFLPLPLQYVGELLPLTWGVTAVRDSVAGASLTTILPVWGFLSLSLLVSLALAIGLWDVFEHRALSTGSIVRF